MIKQAVLNIGAPLNEWELFVLRHRRTPNIIFHIISFSLFWMSIPLAFIFHNPFWLIGFFSSGLVGTSGHYFFSDGTVDGKEASSSPQVVYFSSRMVLQFIFGRYKREIISAEARFVQYLRGEITSEISSEEMKKKIGIQFLKQSHEANQHNEQEFNSDL